MLNHVLLHQTVEGLELKKQFDLTDDYPDVMFGCCGGGSNFPGMVFPFIPDKMKDKKDLRMVACEPSACPSLTKGLYAYDFGDTAGMAPVIKMYTLGHDFIPPGIHAGGLRYHGDAPLLCNLVHDGLIEASSPAADGGLRSGHPLRPQRRYNSCPRSGSRHQASH